MGRDLYAATVTAVPFMLLALVADTRVFGPVSDAHHKRIELFLDLMMLLTLGVAFFTSLAGLALDNPPDMRPYAAIGLGLGALGVFLHALGRVLDLHRDAESDGGVVEPPE